MNSRGASAVSTIDVTSCWATIGVAGDATCPELKAHIHCRNCPVYANAANTLFDRPALIDYTREWTELLASPRPGKPELTPPLLVFRLRAEWLAIEVQHVKEVTELRSVHRVPHRQSNILAGLVNIRGELHNTVHFAELLGIEAQTGPADDNGAAARTTANRMILLDSGLERWVFAAEQVWGVMRVERTRLAEPPVSITKARQHFSKSVFEWEARSVAWLDAALIFSALDRSAV